MTRVQHKLTNKCVPDLCPHRGAPMADAFVVEDVIVCSWHGSVFSLLDGRAVSGPSPVGISVKIVELESDSAS
jgi:nitrite reductase/ring-hydroxylating ferredoxin subunit